MSRPWWNEKPPSPSRSVRAIARPWKTRARVAEATADRMRAVERLHRPAVAARAAGARRLACATESRASAAMTNSGSDEGGERAARLRWCVR